jgi:hypothetical protein
MSIYQCLPARCLTQSAHAKICIDFLNCLDTIPVFQYHMKTPIKPNTFNILQLYWKRKEINGSKILPANETCWSIWSINPNFSLKCTTFFICVPSDQFRVSFLANIRFWMSDFIKVLNIFFNYWHGVPYLAFQTKV